MTEGGGIMRKKIALYLGETTGELQEKITKALSPLPDTWEKEMLIELARYNAFRKI